MNPILPSHYFVPDVEAHQWFDGRMYLYGSLDMAGDTDYCSRKYHVFSSSNLVDWTDHGTCFDTETFDLGVPGRNLPLYAPDCLELNRKYYLFYCTSDGGEGVAVSVSPTGPFQTPLPIAGAHCDGIDPAVFLDDDGAVYLFWGQTNLRGAKLTPDLTSIDFASKQESLLTEATHGFHEGASIRKRQGVYYILYTDITRGRPTCLSYAIAQSPLGPYTKMGVLIDNSSCDPQSWNNHGSIASFRGQWYIFYHRSSHNSRFSRRVCVEPIQFNRDGTIDEVVMTTQGILGPIPKDFRIDAGRACELRGKLYVTALEQAPGDCILGDRLTNIHSGDVALYRYIDFTRCVTEFVVSASSATYGGSIEIRLDDQDGLMVGQCTIPFTGSWNSWQIITAPFDKITGVHVVFLSFKGDWRGRLLDLQWLSFR